MNKIQKTVTNNYYDEAHALMCATSPSLVIHHLAIETIAKWEDVAYTSMEEAHFMGDIEEEARLFALVKVETVKKRISRW